LRRVVGEVGIPHPTATIIPEFYEAPMSRGLLV
jgi:hypothetical protein